MNVRQFYKRAIGEMQFEPEYQAVINYAIANSIATPSRNINLRNNLRVKRLKEEGLWTNIDLLYFFDQEFGKEEFAKLNVISPGDFTIYNDPGLLADFVADLGFKGSSTKFIRTGFNLSIDLNNASNDGISFFYKCFDATTNPSNTKNYFAARTGNNINQIVVQNNNDSQLFRVLNAASSSGIFNNIRNNESILISSDKVNLNNLYENGILFDTAQSMIGTFSNLELPLLAFNNNGSFIGATDVGMKYFGIAGNFGFGSPNINAVNLHKILEDKS